MARHAKIRIGISGWRYAPWRGVFYPRGLVQRRELEFASAHFDSIELNGSFYSLQRPASYLRWHAQTPQDFVFAVKAPRFITHMRRLRDIDAPLGRFFASGVLGLGEKLGPLLWQFPPNFTFDERLWTAFLELLPKDTGAAIACARRSGARDVAATTRVRPLRHAVEIRNDSFRDERFVALLRRHRVALVVADTAGLWPLVEDITADFLYLRLHGNEKLYASGYADRALRYWASRIGTWAQGRQPKDAARISGTNPRERRIRDVYCYFDNDAKVRAPFDARRLREILRLPARAWTPDAAGAPDGPRSLPRRRSRA